jgi:2-polyprenyl-3-methyl-5-hydroxy-6-metoxy-1,4-benzoquinol methylase
MQQQIGQVNWLDDIAIDAPPCPGCGATGGQKAVLETPSAILQNPTVMRLVACGACRTRYWTDLSTFHYEEAAGYAWGNRFYVEQGASVDGLIEPIARLPATRIGSCLEIGCGFGLSLDAARVLFGWRTVGVDPSPLAAAGKAALDLDIRPIYADTDTELGGPFDVVYGSEVIEHVPTPHDFLKICRAHLAPGGVLVLTTPDGDDIRPDVPASALLPILSPGHHLILYTADSLREIVQRAGFAFTQIVPREYGLVLYASDRPLEIAPGDLDRTLFRSYLTRALAVPGRPDDLRTGLRYRLFKEMVNMGDYAAALGFFDEIAADCRARFGLELTPAIAPSPRRLIRTGTRSDDFGVPFCLPGLMFFRGMIALNASTRPGDAAAWFDAAAQAAAAFRETYREQGVDDGETGMIERSAPEHALLALCHADPGQAVDRLRGLDDVPQTLLEAVAFRMLDLGLFDDAKRVSALSQLPGLKSMADGWEHVVHGRNVEAHAALADAVAAGGALGRRAIAADMLALASADPDAAVRVALEPGNTSLPRGALFTRLIDLGHLAQAAAIEPAAVADEGWDMLAHRGMLALLHVPNPAAAAEFFKEAAAAAPAGEVWNLKYHQLLALIQAADAMAAQGVAQELLAAGGAVPKDVRGKVDSLLRDHPAIR